MFNVVSQNGCNAYTIAIYADYAVITRGLLSNTNATFTGCTLLKEGHYTEQYKCYLYRWYSTERIQLLITICLLYLPYSMLLKENNY